MIQLIASAVCIWWFRFDLWSWSLDLLVHLFKRLEWLNRMIEWNNWTEQLNKMIEQNDWMVFFKKTFWFKNATKIWSMVRYIISEWTLLKEIQCLFYSITVLRALCLLDIWTNHLSNKMATPQRIQISLISTYMVSHWRSKFHIYYQHSNIFLKWKFNSVFLA